MERKGERTRTRMVESMLELIQARGYSGTGLNAVTEHVGAPKGSLYFHFPEGKESLGAQAIELAATQFRQLFESATLEAGSPAEVLHRVVDTLSRMLTDSDYQLGCPVSVVTLEMGAHSERLRAACSTAYDSWVTALENWLQANDIPRARVLATTVVSAIEGAIIMSRAQRDTEPLRNTATLITALLD